MDRTPSSSRRWGEAMRIALAAGLALTLPLGLAACSQESGPPVESEVAPVGTADDANLREAERSLADPTEQGPTRQLTAIPQRFRGVWDAVDGNCAPASDLRIEIGERSLGFYEARGAVTDIVADGPDAVVVTLAMEGEGERWTVRRRFALAEDGRLIPTAPAGEEDFEPTPLKRCET